VKSIDIPLLFRFLVSCIDRVTLSPWLNQRLCTHVKRNLWSIAGRRDPEIVRSTLISNEEWKKFGESATSLARHVETVTGVIQPDFGPACWGETIPLPIIPTCIEAVIRIY
jgi:hypothetical protein